MDMIELIIGLVLGLLTALLAVWLKGRSTPPPVAPEQLVEQLRDAFGNLSQQALKNAGEQFLQLAETRLEKQTSIGQQTLEEKKKLIDKNVEQMAGKLGELAGLLKNLDADRRQSNGALHQRLESTTQATAELRKTTDQLRQALANPQRRGQWGERMAEDVLRLAGMIEGVNYTKQSVTDSGSKPDFTFLLPQDRRVNMDVKFPLPNYLKYLEAEEDSHERQQAKVAFLRDVRARIKEVTTRDYIDPAGGTLGYVLIFIPNEQVYSFIHEHDPALMDEALQRCVVLCSPLTLYAMLSVIRQAAENYRLEQTSREILALLGEFNKQWNKFTDGMDKMGKRLEDAMKEYEALATTRTRQLERQLDKIENLRNAEQVALPDGED